MRALTLLSQFLENGTPNLTDMPLFLGCTVIEFEHKILDQVKMTYF